MFKRTMIFVMSCCFAAPLMTSCGDDSGSGDTPVCPDSCDVGQHCDEATGTCVADVVNEVKECAEACATGKHCDTTKGECVDDEVQPQVKECAQACGEGKHCDTTKGECVNDEAQPEVKECAEACGEGQHCDTTKGECVDDEVQPEVKECAEACGEGQHCDTTKGECVEDEAQPKECAEECGEGRHCDTTVGECIDDETPQKQCPEDCGEGKYCNESTAFECVLIPKYACPDCEEGFSCRSDTGKCVSDEDAQKVGCPKSCPEGFSCDSETTTNGLCMGKNDESEDILACPTCAEGAHCDEVEYKCVNDGYVEPEVDPDACQGEEKRCNENVLQNCVDGKFADAENCVTEEMPNGACFTNEEGVLGCYESECDPQTAACDGTILKTCNVYHKYETSDCAELEETPVCEAGEGHAECIAMCTPDETKCLDNNVMKCGEDGLFALEANCDPANAGCKVVDDVAACVDYTCQGQMTQCDGKKLMECKEGWLELFSDCEASGFVCRTKSTTEAVCEAPNCIEGDRKCNGDWLLECQNGEFVNKESCSQKGRSCVSDNGVMCKEIKEAAQGEDSDGDTIIDALECHPEDTSLGMDGNCVDTDGDTVPDYLDLDSDGDTIPDKIEANNSNGLYEPDDADYDGIPNYLDDDSDNNGIFDKDECKGTVDPNTGFFKDCIDTDNNNVSDFLDYDNDGDGFSDVDEIKGLVINSSHEAEGHFSGACGGKNTLGTPENPVDCDGDKVPDYMSIDSDGDGLTDAAEGWLRLASNGFLARYSTDTDGDGISDDVEGLTDDSDGDGIPNFLETDSDNDGLSDAYEYTLENVQPCKANKMKPRLSADTDGDGFKDAAEDAVAKETQKEGYKGTKYTEATMICDNKIGVKNIYNFYFELPDNAKKDDVLTFTPKVSKLDVVFNMDTTTSMGEEVENLKDRIREYIIPQVRKKVSDSGFGVTRFDDFPTNGYGYYYKNSNFYNDLPFVLYGTVSTNDVTVQNNVNQLSIHAGADNPEAGYESLWQIAKGEDKKYSQVSWVKSGDSNDYVDGSLSYCTPPAGTWGCAGFRSGTLPVVVHITDAPSHDTSASPYSTTYVKNPHYSAVVHDAYKEKGARVIAISAHQTTTLTDITNTAKTTNAIVPVCAFKTASNTWTCGENKCCTLSNANGGVVAKDPDGTSADNVKTCTLSYAVGKATAMSDTLVNGIDALVKYGTYDVQTVIRGEEIADNGKSTSCFIDKVEAKAYVAPPNEPEKSCNPVAKPAKFKNATYNNGFSNFATGTSNANIQGSQLTFTVYAKNNGCFKQTKETRVFTAYIDVVDPTTGVVFDTQPVSILVPGLIEDNVGESGN